MNEEKTFRVWFIICGILGIGLTGFIVWVVIKLLQHFGVI